MESILNMKQSLHIKLNQQLTITPQLQYAIKMLQLSSTELETEIENFLVENPLLEKIDDDYSHNFTKLSAGLNAGLSASTNGNTNTNNYDGNQISNLETASKAESLQDYLIWQTNLTPFSETDYTIALALIDSISDDGYLMTSLEDIRQTLSATTPIEDLQQIETVLHRIQQFDPVGIGARNLKECLAIQICQLAPDTPFLQLCHNLIDNYLDLLAQKNYSKLQNKLSVSQKELKTIINTITSLNARPGRSVTCSQSEYIIPDVIVSKHHNRWLVSLNPELASKLQINPVYSKMLNNDDAMRYNKFIQEQMNDAKWFMKSLKHRNDTLLKVANCIIKQQLDFLEGGIQKIKPLTLQAIASRTQLHESTISRITTKKYINTPHGTFELKFFFSSYVTTETGNNCSSIAIKAVIKKIILEENSLTPLSDQKIATILKERGINIARRTVTKYREAMSIAASSQRKNLNSYTKES